MDNKGFIIGIFTVALTLSTSSFAEWYQANATPSLVIRKSPDVSSSKLGNVPPQGKVDVVEKTTKRDFIGGRAGNWVKVIWKNDVGYAFDAFLEPISNKTTSSEITEKEKPDEPILQEKVTMESKVSEPVPSNQKVSLESKGSESTDLENIKVPLGILFEGAGLLESGKYSRAQIEELFKKNYINKEYLVSGEVTDIGSTFSGEKYLTIKVSPSQFFEVYPKADFNILDYAKGQQLTFWGTWTEVGTGIMVKHKIKQASQLK